MSAPPRVVIAAPASGHGKTTVATGLIAAFTRRGDVVSPHKVGPDYIDPGYHALAAGRVGRNLDPFLVGEERIGPLFAHGARGADLAVIEGVMGLFDGAAGRGGYASTAHVARLLGAPVVLVVDARAQSRSVAALVRGFDTFEPAVGVAGVVLNRVGSDRHESMLREALDEIGMPVLGVLRRHDSIAKPARHLGLVPVAERHADAVRTVEALGELIARSVDLAAVRRIAAGARALPDAPWNAAEEVGGPVAGRPRIALAGGSAFTFAYAETAELLGAAGAEVVTVDPLRDERLPERTAGLVVGGGFPEVYAAELAANATLRADVVALAGRGGPIAAECAGLLYLARSLDGAPMCGVLPADARMTERLTLGYREATAAHDSVLAATGRVVRGHEFHRTTLTPRAGGRPAWSLGETGFEGHVVGSVHASYLHTHWAGAPDLPRRFVDACVAAGATAGTPVPSGTGEEVTLGA
ncbi:cobyrinic acid a,c-diamide synthase [Embleya scabrispora]|uniref:Hydrogenobyrinate a,c-diamide synthase n=1 Tax=Embleya scabrispora TaxID=159449 RepID=A0A1T3P931_9ACTN|nr:cobyrinate a,c-diamide synthase [Embleya scabrispora]OPC85370.1 cobyrinic acid a,c-diamide synthase [Embleya scabrispora]